MMKDIDIKLNDTIRRYITSGIEQQVDYEKFYLYSLITHSTAIEGSTVTEVENQLLFDEDIAAKGRSLNEQMMNIDLKNAYVFGFNWAKNPKPYTMKFLCELSEMVMRQLGLIPSIVTRDNKAEYIQALIDTRESEEPTIIQDVMLQQHIQNLEDRILQYHQSFDDTVNDTVKTPMLQSLLSAIKEHPDYTYEQYATMLGVSRATIARNIKKLSESKYISRTGADKDGYWEILKQ